MEHSKEYLQAKWVIDNPNDYEQQMVFDAQNFIRGYEQALNILLVSKQREQLIAFYRKMLNNMYKGYTNETIERHVDKFLKTN
jgi:hypothetical protein